MAFASAGSRSVLEKLADPYLQTASQRLYRVKGRVCLTPLDPAHIGPGEAAALCEVLLRHPGRAA